MGEYKALSAIEAIRTRPGMYIGSTDTPNQLITEILDNALDELANGHATKVAVNIKENICQIFDNGRGINVYKMKDTNGNLQDSVILLCTSNHTGSKFETSNDYKTLIGMHGVGLVVVNALSKYLKVTTRDRKNKSIIYSYLFEDGNFVDKQLIKDSEQTKDWSTIVEFEVNEKYFENSFNLLPIVERLYLVQSKFNTCEFYFNNKPIPKNSFKEYAQKILKVDNIDVVNYTKSPSEKVIAYFTFTEGDHDTIVLGDVNLRNCDGLYLTNFQTIIKNIVSENIDKKLTDVNQNLFLDGLKAYVSLTIPEPTFDSQNKTRMTLNVRDIINPLKTKLEKIIKTKYIEIIENNIKNKLEKKIVKKLEKTSTKIKSSNKLKDCVNTPGEVIYIVEGDSAAGPLKQIRNPKTEAVFPIRGKMLNVEKASLAKIQDNKEIQDLIEALGPKSKRRYEKIKILADADKDGYHIVVLILTTICKFADDMIKEGRVSIILPPLYGAISKNEFVPIYLESELQKYKNNPKYEIIRFKGLGEMSPKRLESVIRSGKEYIVSYPDDKKSLDVLLDIMKNTDLKKQLLKKTNLNFDYLLSKTL